MAKRKVQENEDGDFSDVQEGSIEQSSDDDTPVSMTVSKNASKKTQTQEKIKKPPVKRSKAMTASSESSSTTDETLQPNAKILTNSEGDKYIDLGKKKRAVVRSFKGIALLDIREYYGADGEEKPGKKGISLTLEQWKLLRENSSAIDQFFSEKK